MQENWVKIEYLFREQGIYFELKGWFYRCLIEDRCFYYSPSTGKWRMKGKMLWLPSTSPEDFIAQAKVYEPPNYKSKSSQSQQSQAEELAGIRNKFLSIFGDYLEQQRKRGYKIGWIWYKLIEEFIPSKLEICWLSVVFGYSDGWAFHKIREVHGYAEPGSISATIKKHKLEWLDYFEQRWGIFEQQQKQQESKEHKQYQERRQYQERKQYKQQQKTSDSHQRQHRSTASTFAHQAYLQLLGLTLPFTIKELKTAYRRMALQAHPDAGGSAEAFRQIHHAYQTLSVYGVK